MKYLLIAAMLAASLLPASAMAKNKFPPAPKCAKCENTLVVPVRYYAKRLHMIFKPLSHPEPFKDVLAGCRARAQAVDETSSALYGWGWGTVDAVDDFRSCVARHGYRLLGFRQSNGKLTSYPAYDPRMDY